MRGTSCILALHRPPTSKIALGDGLSWFMCKQRLLLLYSRSRLPHEQALLLIFLPFYFFFFCLVTSVTVEFTPTDSQTMSITSRLTHRGRTGGATRPTPETGANATDLWLRSQLTNREVPERRMYLNRESSKATAVQSHLSVACGY